MGSRRRIIHRFKCPGTKTDEVPFGQLTSIAVGGSPFIERIKNAMGAMAKGRSVQPTKGAFELREAQSAYNAIFDPENQRIEPK